MPRLVVEKGHDKGKVFVIQPKTTLIVGRDASATANLRDTMCSRQHFRVEAREDGYYVIDLGSLNGTQVNGKPVKEQKLQFGDLIKTGETLLSFLSDETTVEQSMVGQRLGGYKIIERIGRGGMGTVYKAEQIDLQRIVALKVIAPEHAKDKDFTDLFVHEARASAKLNHQNIVQVYDVKKQGDLYYFSMEYVPGGSVQELLNKQRKLPADQAVHMILDAARGLDYAHKKDIIHRDVKPDNLMVSETGGIKIGDLGLAQRLGEKLSADDENSIIGTPHYIAPEQVLGKPADYRSDIYALGSTMYRMIAGVTPYQAPGVRELMNRKVKEDAPPLDETAEGLSRRLGEICSKMMARRPEERYQTMAEVVADLEEYRAAGGEPVPLEELGESVGNKNLLLAAVGLLIVAVVGGVIGAVAFLRKPPPPPPQSGPVTPVDPPDDGSKAAAIQKLENAKLYELKHMDPNKPEDLQRAILEFRGVVEHFPNTEFAEDAQRHIDALGRRLRETTAGIAFAEIEKQDGDNWRKTHQAFQGGTFDLQHIDATAAAYAQFAAAEETRETTPGREAARRASFVAAWKARVDELRGEFEKVRQEAATKRNAELFNEAWLMLDAFAQQAAAKKIECTFASDRYTGPLFDEAAREEQKKVMDAARVAYYRIDEQVGELERAKKFEEAVRRLAPVTEAYPEELRLRALTRQKALNDSWAQHREEEALRALREAESAGAADAQDFEKLAREARKDILAVDFKAAAGRFAAAGGSDRFPRTQKYRDRVKARAAELAILADFKEALKRMVNDPRGYPGFKRDSAFPGAQGWITKMDDREFTIQAESGGTLSLALKDIRPSAFYAYLRGAYGWPDAKSQQGLILYCCEAGLYEAALKALAALAQSAGAKDKSIEEFCAAYRKLLEAGEYTDSDEVEAEKRMARAKQFKEEGSLESAKREIDRLLGRYKGTKFVEDHKAEIRKLRDDVMEKGGDDLRKKMKGEQYKQIMDLRDAERAEAAANDGDVVKRLSKINDNAVLRDARLGEYYAAQGEWSKSNTSLQSARMIGDRFIADRTLANDYLYLVGTVYVQLYRNAIVNRNKAAAAEIRKDAEAKFAVRWGVDWWPGMARRMEQAEIRFNGVRDVGLLERALKEDPESALRLWELADACVATRRYLDARGYLRALIELYPEAAAVRSGEAQYLLAEVLLSFHDVKRALALYREVEEEHRDHPKVKEGGGEDGVKRRVRLCYDLMNRMKIEPDEEKK